MTGDNTNKYINPFSTNAPLLYLLKTENREFSDVFGGHRSGTLVESGLIKKKCKSSVFLKNVNFSKTFFKLHKVLSSCAKFQVFGVLLSKTKLDCNFIPSPPRAKVEVGVKKLFHRMIFQAQYSS